MAMTEDDVRGDAPAWDEPLCAAMIAGYVARAAWLACGGADSVYPDVWIDDGGVSFDASPGDLMLDALAGFVRDNPGAPPEAVWRAAAGWGFAGPIEPGDPDPWRELSFAARAAYALFTLAVPLAERLLAERQDETAPPPPPAAPLRIKEADTIFRRAPTIFARSDDAPRFVTIGGPDGGTDGDETGGAAEAQAAEGAAEAGAASGLHKAGSGGASGGGRADPDQQVGAADAPGDRADLADRDGAAVAATVKPGKRRR